MKKALLITIIIVSILSFNLWMLFPFQVFYKGLAIVFILSAALIRIDSQKNTQYRYICDVWLLLTTNNLIDEFFFNPRALEWNEYLFGMAIVVHAAIKANKNGTMEKGDN